MKDAYNNFKKIINIINLVITINAGIVIKNQYVDIALAGFIWKQEIMKLFQNFIVN